MAFIQSKGWILIPLSPEANARRGMAKVLADRIERECREGMDAQVQERLAAIRAESDLGHEYRIVITLKDIRDMDHAWSVMQSLRLDGGNIEGAVVEMAERRQYPPKQEGEE